MNNRPTRTITAAIAFALFVLWMVPGLVGRDLWKADEPYSFGLVEHIVKTGDLVVPTLAGEPFMEKPPLFFLTAAGFVRLLSPWLLQPHDAARLAAAFYMLVTVLFIGLAARELYGPECIGTAILFLIANAGIQITTHKLITDVAMIAGISISIYGTALTLRKPVAGGFWTGTGAGIGFLSKGLLAPGIIGVIALVLPALFKTWRTRSYFKGLFIAFVAALPWAVIWPAALYLRSPRLFTEWFWYENLGRFLGYGNVGRKFSPFSYFFDLPWFALPSLPVAIWAVWHHRKQVQNHTGIQLPLVVFLVMFTVLSLSSSIRSIYALPMLLPLSILAAKGADSLPDRAGRAMNRTALILFGLVAAILWISWFVMMTGTPAPLAKQLLRMQPDYSPAPDRVLLSAAVLYTVIVIVAQRRSMLFQHSYLVNWTLGIILAWALAMTLWLPALDAGSGYRSMFVSMKEKLPGRARFVTTLGVGESERALMEYYTEVLPRGIEGRGIWDCDLLLVESGSERTAPPAEADWETIWEWKRPHAGSRTKEIFSLYQRRGGKAMCE